MGLVAAAAAFAALPATALAAGEALTVVPSNTQAGGSTAVTTTLTFATGDTPKTVVTSLAPGMLGDLNANPACLIGSPQLTASCQIGTAAAHTDVAGDITGNLYLVPPQGTDSAGIDFVTPSGPQYIGVSPNPNSPGALNLTTTFPNPAPAHFKGFTANFATLNGQAFTRLPSSCAPATSTMNATYYGATPAGSASGSFTPTGCASLPYAPNITAAITKDKSGNGAALTLVMTQAANESASKTIVLNLAKGLTPNVGVDAPCLNATGCTVGTATATSPLIPSIALANGTVKLTAQGTTPTIAVSFPALGVTLNGVVNLTSNSVTFNGVPDVPLTNLTLNVTGPSGGKAFNTDCAPGNVSGAFTAQSGATHSASTAIKFTGCNVAPTATGSTSGLASGHSQLKFKVTHGQGSANIASVAIGLPAGLKFSHSAFVSHKTCTTKKGKKKCTTTTLIRGLGISGAAAKSVALTGGKLVVTLKKAASSVTINAGGPLVSETAALQSKVKKHKTKSLTFTLKVTDAKHAASTLSLKLAAH